MNQTLSRNSIRSLRVSERSWPMKEPFAISRGTQTVAEVIVVELEQDGVVGRGEASGVPYAGETQRSMRQQIEAVHLPMERGVTREQLLELLPAGGARNALDAALWDLEAGLSGVPAWQSAGVGRGGAITSAYTIGIRSIEGYERAAEALRDYAWIKIKVDGGDSVAAVSAVRRKAPNARFVVDANQAWSLQQLKHYGPIMADLGVALLEQPVRRGLDERIADARGPVPVCADESCATIDDIPYLVGRYDYVNIKLDKTGGLTSALRLADAARRAGLRLMVGCMCGSSLAMAPAAVLGQICEVVDLDGPLLQSEDWPDGIVYDHGRMAPPWPGFWG
ncbi:MAG: N-acetyl-D-Glu racemase DgcA, partial [Myxococcota bacterium]